MTGIMTRFSIFILYSLYMISCNQLQVGGNEEAIVKPETKSYIKAKDHCALRKLKVKQIFRPTSTEAIQDYVMASDDQISIAGARYSVGGQTVIDHGLQIDLVNFKKVVNFNLANKEITVQAGITWNELIQYIDKFDLSVQVMQSYSNFSVGGSLSVNCHGRYVGYGPIISTVKDVKIVLANGDVKVASRTENSDLFYAVIGGYGFLGVIVEATLMLTENSKLEKIASKIALSEYRDFFMENIYNNKDIVFHNADISLSTFDEVSAISFIKTDTAIVNTSKFRKLSKASFPSKLAITLGTQFTGSIFSKLKENYLNPVSLNRNTIVYRNFEATQDVSSLEPLNRVTSTFPLQEYFVPVDRVDEFLQRMKKIFKENKTDVLNVSIRHAKQDPDSYLTWARESDVFAFVLYFKQWFYRDPENWTKLLIDAVIECGGSYYLPYQLFATQDQFQKSYPRYKELFELKKEYDPTNRFSNSLWKKYYKPEN